MEFEGRDEISEDDIIKKIGLVRGQVFPPQEPIKIEKEIKNVQKYQNQTNTIDVCILVVPEGILEAIPEIVSLGRESNVFVCSYRDVFPVVYLVQEKYQHFKEQGDIGTYRQLISTLFQILDKIEQKTNAIQNAITTISNANSAIKKQILVARQKPSGIEVELKSEEDTQET